MFKPGQPKIAGRKKGTQNKSTQSVGQFCRDVLETTEFQEKWRDYFKTTPLRLMEPKLLALAFAYAYGKPRERVESTGAGNGTFQSNVSFYLPNNNRNPSIVRDNESEPKTRSS